MSELMNKLIIISGPTAVGKSKISIEVAKKMNCEIISADSMQIYKYMDIGSAKITKEEMEGIPHHLINIRHPQEGFSVSEFKSEALKVIKQIYERGTIPLLTGGTGLYIDSLIRDYSFANTDKDEEYRSYLETYALENGREGLHNLLKERDPESFEKLYPNDLKRVIRALEIFKVTGKKIGELTDVKVKNENEYDLHYFVLNMNREDLYNRINERVDKMMENGLLDEVAKLNKMGYTTFMQSMKGIGYKELLEYLNGLITLSDAVEKIKKGSRNYAKRQLTWFRKDKRIIWINKDEFSDEGQIVDFIINNIKS